LDILNKEMLGQEYFDVAQYPSAHYVSDSVSFKNGAPVAIDGQLTLKGITHPVRLEVRSFKCLAMLNRRLCGADARPQLDRAQFNPAAGNTSQVTLYIEVEACTGN
jgi:polyisoprenoid-binding protein YceI